MRAFIFSLSLLVLLSTLSGAIRPLELKELAGNAELIVRGRIVALTPFEAEGLVFTRVSLAVDELIEGTPEKAGGVLEFRIPGGSVGQLTLHASEAPHYELGEEVVVFLRFGTPHCDVYGWERGSFVIENGRIPSWSHGMLASFLSAIHRAREEGR